MKGKSLRDIFVKVCKVGITHFWKKWLIWIANLCLYIIYLWDAAIVGTTEIQGHWFVCTSTINVSHLRVCDWNKEKTKQFIGWFITNFRAYPQNNLIRNKNKDVTQATNKLGTKVGRYKRIWRYATGSCRKWREDEYRQAVQWGTQLAIRTKNKGTNLYPYRLCSPRAV